METKTLIASDLLKIKAVFLRPEEPFTWASGIKSPIYCDNRLTLTAPEVRTDVENAPCRTHPQKISECRSPHGNLDRRYRSCRYYRTSFESAMGYVRSGAKDHGRQNQIEGKLEKGQKVVVVGGLISTGGRPRDAKW